MWIVPIPSLWANGPGVTLWTRLGHLNWGSLSLGPDYVQIQTFDPSNYRFFWL